MTSTYRLQNLLKSHGCNEEVIAHSTAVAEFAVEIARELQIDLDVKAIQEGAFLHDMGRSKTHDLNHFIIGAELARAEGFPDKVIKIIERHVGAGITREEAASLGLPPGDYIPTSPEEIIVSYADNLTKGTRQVTYQQALERFKSKLGEDHPSIERFKEQHETIEKWRNTNPL